MKVIISIRASLRPPATTTPPAKFPKAECRMFMRQRFPKQSPSASSLTLIYSLRTRVGTKSRLEYHRHSQCRAVLTRPLLFLLNEVSGDTRRLAGWGMPTSARLRVDNRPCQVDYLNVT